MSSPLFSGHELTHYLRRDLWYKLLLLAVSTIYWFNPALLLMQREAEKRHRKSLRQPCRQTLQPQGRIAYGQLLLKTAHSRVTSLIFPPD